MLDRPELDPNPAALGAPPPVFDPARPIQRVPSSSRASAQSQNQRHRRAMILATIRGLLVDEGIERVTVRRVAECSGHAVQTIYNLVGPRNLAITEAITEYSQYVCLTAMPNPKDPLASIAMIEREVSSIKVNPDFCRNVCMIFFSDARQIFYDFRDRQARNLYFFLLQQQKLGIIRADANARDLAERIMMLAGAIFVEWADRAFELELLQQRLYATHWSLLAETVAPGPNRTAYSLA